jgi:glycosyltransferase involved in cell wall biosynthesis
MLQLEVNAVAPELPKLAAPCAVSFFLPNLLQGGAEKVTVHLANGLAARGYSVDMVLFAARGEFLAELDASIRVVDLKAGRLLWAIPRFARYLRQARPAVVISALDHVNVGVILARLISATSIPVVVTIHATQSMAAKYRRGFRSRVVRWFGRWCYRRARAIVCVSRGVADDLVASAGADRERIRVIYNPVVSQRMIEMAREPLDHPWFCPAAPPVVLAVGRLTAAKDYPTLIRAFASARSQRDLRLMILGEGEDRPRLERLVGELGLNNCVALPGFAANPYTYMAKAAVFVLSSISEALPTGLIEALALGVPIVATDCPCGPREILQDGRFGAMVPVADAEALTRGILDSLSRPRCEAPAEAVRPFTLDYAVDDYCRLIEEVATHG